MKRLWRNVSQAADLARLLWVSWRYARSERAENERRYPSLDQMTDERIAARSALRKNGPIR